MMPPAMPTTSCAPSPRPGLQSGPLPTQHGAPPPSTHPATSPQHPHNNPITHNPVPTTSTGPAAPYNFTMPSPPALVPQPAPAFSQSTTDTTTKATAPPGPTQQPTPTTHTQQPNSSHIHRSRAPLSRHRRSRRSRQHRSSTPHNKDPLDDIQHHEDAAIDTTAADPHAVGLLTPDEGWILDQAYPAPEADGVPDEGPQAPPAALHPGRAHPPHQESGCSLLTFSANNCSA